MANLKQRKTREAFSQLFSETESEVLLVRAPSIMQLLSSPRLSCVFDDFTFDEIEPALLFSWYQNEDSVELIVSFESGEDVTIEHSIKDTYGSVNYDSVNAAFPELVTLVHTLKGGVN